MLAVPPQSAFHCVDVGDDGTITSVSTAAARCRSGRTAATSCSGRRSSTTSRRTATWSRTAATALAKEGRMLAYPYRGFWQPADTVKERTALEAAYQSGNRPWMLWDPRAQPSAPPAGHDRGPARQRSTNADAQPAARAPRPAGAARRALRRHRDRRGRLAAGAVPGPPRALGRGARAHRRRVAARGGGTGRAGRVLPGRAAARSTVLDLPDGRVPTRWERAKGALEELRGAGEPDLILAPHRARRPPGPPHAGQARAHRLPRPPHAGLRDPQVGVATSPSPPSSCRSPSR